MVLNKASNAYISAMFRRVYNFARLKYLLIPLFAMASLSCRKSEPDLEPYYEPTYGNLKYLIQGVKDVSMERIGSANVNIYINRQEGKIENVMLTAINLPQGLSVTFTPNISLPSFNSTMTVKSTRVKEGTYEITVRGSSQTSGFTDVKMKVTILPYANAADGQVGLFKEQGLCSQGGIVGDTVDVVKDETFVNKIRIKGFWSGVWSNAVDAFMNTTNKTLTIPAQTLNGVTINGTGTYDDDEMKINYRVKGFTVDDTCSSTLTRIK